MSRKSPAQSAKKSKSAKTITVRTPPPPLYRDDLSFCRTDQKERTAWLKARRAEAARVEGRDAARELAEMLNGTWELRARTIQGVPLDISNTYRFDLKVGEAEAKLVPSAAATKTVDGSALALEDGVMSSLKATTTQASLRAQPGDLFRLGAHWDVNIAQTKDGGARLTMKGEYLGSFGVFQKPVYHTEEGVFYREGEAYVMVGGLSSPTMLPEEMDTWDKIVIGRERMIWLSCRNGYLDEYVKVGGLRTVAEAGSLRGFWEQAKADGTLTEPPATWARRFALELPTMKAEARNQEKS